MTFQSSLHHLKILDGVRLLRHSMHDKGTPWFFVIALLKVHRAGPPKQGEIQKILAISNLHSPLYFRPIRVFLASYLLLSVFLAL